MSHHFNPYPTDQQSSAPTRIGHSSAQAQSGPQRTSHSNPGSSYRFAPSVLSPNTPSLLDLPLPAFMAAQRRPAKEEDPKRSADLYSSRAREESLHPPRSYAMTPPSQGHRKAVAESSDRSLDWLPTFKSTNEDDASKYYTSASSSIFSGGGESRTLASSSIFPGGGESRTSATSSIFPGGGGESRTSAASSIFPGGGESRTSAASSIFPGGGESRTSAASSIFSDGGESRFMTIGERKPHEQSILGLGENKFPVRETASAQPEFSRPKYTSEAASKILMHFGLEKEDLEQLLSYTEDQITPESLPFILRQIRQQKTKKSVSAVETLPYPEPKPTTSESDTDFRDHMREVPHQDYRPRGILKTRKVIDYGHVRQFSTGPVEEVGIASGAHSVGSSTLLMDSSGRETKDMSISSLISSCDQDSSVPGLGSPSSFKLSSKSLPTSNPPKQFQPPSKQTASVPFTISKTDMDSGILPGVSKSFSLKEPEPSQLKSSKPCLSDTHSPSVASGRLGIVLYDNLNDPHQPLKQVPKVPESKKKQQQQEVKKPQPTAERSPTCQVDTASGVPAPAQMYDYVATPPRMYPHSCSLCNKECFSVKEWINHQNTELHLEYCKLLRTRFPEWDGELPTSISVSDVEARSSTTRPSQSCKKRRNGSSHSSSRSYSPQRHHGSGSRRDQERSRYRRRSRSNSPHQRSRRTHRSHSRSRSQSPLYRSNASRYRSRSRSYERRSSPRQRDDGRFSAKRSRSGERRSLEKSSARQMPSGSAEALAKKLLGSSAIQALSNQSDLETVVKTLAPAILAELTKMKTSPSSSSSSSVSKKDPKTKTKTVSADDAASTVRLLSVHKGISHSHLEETARLFGKPTSVVIFKTLQEAQVVFEKPEDAEKMRNAKSHKLMGMRVKSSGGASSGSQTPAQDRMKAPPIKTGKSIMSSSLSKAQNVPTKPVKVLKSGKQKRETGSTTPSSLSIAQNVTAKPAKVPESGKRQQAAESTTQSYAAKPSNTASAKKPVGQPMKPTVLNKQSQPPQGAKSGPKAPAADKRGSTSSEKKAEQKEKEAAVEVKEPPDTEQPMMPTLVEVLMKQDPPEEVEKLSKEEGIMKQKTGVLPLTGEMLGKYLLMKRIACVDMKSVFSPEFASKNKRVLQITNLPKYEGGSDTERDVANLLTPFGFQHKDERLHNIYVIPQKRMALAVLPTAEMAINVIRASVMNCFKLSGSKLIVKILEDNISTPMEFYVSLMMWMNEKITLDQAKRVVFINNISPNEARNLREVLKKIGNVRNYAPLLNKVFIEFYTIHDADRLGVWYSLLNEPPQHSVYRLGTPRSTATSPLPKMAENALPDLSLRLEGTDVPMNSGIPLECSPPFYVTMTTFPFIFPTSCPWFNIPPCHNTSAVSSTMMITGLPEDGYCQQDVAQMVWSLLHPQNIISLFYRVMVLPLQRRSSTMMITGLPEDGYCQQDVAQMVWSLLHPQNIISLFYRVMVLPLQRRAFIYFNNPEASRKFSRRHSVKPFCIKDKPVKIHFVNHNMDQEFTEPDMYRQLMKWSNAGVSLKSHLEQRLLVVLVSEVSLELIQAVMKEVASVGRLAGFLPLGNRICIEMLEPSDRMKVMEAELGSLTAPHIWNKVVRVYIVQSLDKLHSMDPQSAVLDQDSNSSPSFSTKPAAVNTAPDSGSAPETSKDVEMVEQGSSGAVSAVSKNSSNTECKSQKDKEAVMEVEEPPDKAEKSAEPWIKSTVVEALMTQDPHKEEEKLSREAADWKQKTELTMGEMMEENLLMERIVCHKLNRVFSTGFIHRNARVLQITNLPKYEDDSYTERDVANLLTPFGFQHEDELLHNIYVIPQKRMALAVMQTAEMAINVIRASAVNCLKLSGCELIVKIVAYHFITPMEFYRILMMWMKKKMNASTIVFIKNISLSEARNLREVLNKIGNVKNYVPLLNKVFIEFSSIQDVDRLGVWYSLLRHPPQHLIYRLGTLQHTGSAQRPRTKMRVFPELLRVIDAHFPTISSIPPGCSPPFTLTMTTFPFLFPTVCPWFNIPPCLKFSAVTLPCSCTIMMTGLPVEHYRQWDVARMVWGLLEQRNFNSLFYRVVVLPLQRRAFIYFNDPESCWEFTRRHIAKPFFIKNKEVMLNFVDHNMNPEFTEETMYRQLMELSNAHVPPLSGLDQRLLVVQVSEVSLRLIQAVMKEVASVGRLAGFLPLGNRICIEMLEPSDRMKVMEAELGSLTDPEIWNKVIRVDTVQSLHQHQLKSLYVTIDPDEDPHWAAPGQTTQDSNSSPSSSTKPAAVNTAPDSGSAPETSKDVEMVEQGSSGAVDADSEKPPDKAEKPAGSSKSTEVEVLVTQDPQEEEKLSKTAVDAKQKTGLTMGEMMEENLLLKRITCVDMKSVLSGSKKFIHRNNRVLQITNLPKYEDGIYTERDVANLLTPFGFQHEDELLHNIYVIPQKRMAFLVLPTAEMAIKVIRASVKNCFKLSGCKLIVKILDDIVRNPMEFYQNLMMWMNEKIQCHHANRIVFIKNISPSEARNLREVLNKIGNLRNYVPLLNKVFIEFYSILDTDCLGVWYSLLRHPPQHIIYRLGIPQSSSTAPFPVWPMRALPDLSLRVIDADVPMITSIPFECSPQFTVTMTTFPFIFPTVCPWFNIPPYQDLSAVDTPSCYSTIMMTGLPVERYSQLDVAQMVWGHRHQRNVHGLFYRVMVLPLQRRAFIYFNDPESCWEFSRRHIVNPFCINNEPVNIYFVNDNMNPEFTEETMYRQLMKLSNAHVPPLKGLDQRLLVVQVSEVSLRLIQIVMEKVASVGRLASFLPLGNRICIEMLEPSDRMKVMEAELGSLTAPHIWNKVIRVDTVQSLRQHQLQSLDVTINLEEDPHWAAPGQTTQDSNSSPSSSTKPAAVNTAPDSDSAPETSKDVEMVEQGSSGAVDADSEKPPDKAEKPAGLSKSTEVEVLVTQDPQEEEKLSKTAAAVGKLKTGLTMGEMMEENLLLENIFCVYMKRGFSPEFIYRNNRVLQITNLPKYEDGSYTERDVANLLTPFGFQHENERLHNIYVIPQKRMALAVMPTAEMAINVIRASVKNCFKLSGCKLIMKILEDNFSTPMEFYQKLMKWMNEKITLDQAERIVFIKNISPSEARNLREVLKKIGDVRNYVTLLNKVFIDFYSIPDADRLGVWYSFLHPPPQYMIYRLGVPRSTEATQRPSKKMRAYIELLRVIDAHVPSISSIPLGCSPPFTVTMTTFPFLFPTAVPWFNIPPYQDPSEVDTPSNYSTIMMTGLPVEHYCQLDVVQMVWGHLHQRNVYSLFYRVMVLPLQRRAFIYFNDPESCWEFSLRHIINPFCIKKTQVNVYFVNDNMNPEFTEETMYRQLMELSNAHVPPLSGLDQRLLVVLVSEVSVKLIQAVMKEVASVGRLAGFLPLGNRICIEMLEPSDRMKVMEAKLGSLTTPNIWRKVIRVDTVQSLHQRQLQSMDVAHDREEDLQSEEHPEGPTSSEKCPEDQRLSKECLEGPTPSEERPEGAKASVEHPEGLSAGLKLSEERYDGQTPSKQCLEVPTPSEEHLEGLKPTEEHSGLAPSEERSEGLTSSEKHLDDPTLSELHPECMIPSEKCPESPASSEEQSKRLTQSMELPQRLTPIQQLSQGLTSSEELPHGPTSSEEKAGGSTQSEECPEGPITSKQHKTENEERPPMGGDKIKAILALIQQYKQARGKVPLGFTEDIRFLNRYDLRFEQDTDEFTIDEVNDNTKYTGKNSQRSNSSKQQSRQSGQKRSYHETSKHGSKSSNKSNRASERSRSPSASQRRKRDSCATSAREKSWSPERRFHYDMNTSRSPECSFHSDMNKSRRPDRRFLHSKDKSRSPDRWDHWGRGNSQSPKHRSYHGRVKYPSTERRSPNKERKEKCSSTKRNSQLGEEECLGTKSKERSVNTEIMSEQEKSPNSSLAALSAVGLMVSAENTAAEPKNKTPVEAPKEEETSVTQSPKSEEKQDEIESYQNLNSLEGNIEKEEIQLPGPEEDQSLIGLSLRGLDSIDDEDTAEQEESVEPQADTSFQVLDSVSVDQSATDHVTDVAVAENVNNDTKVSNIPKRPRRGRVRKRGRKPKVLKANKDTMDQIHFEVIDSVKNPTKAEDPEPKTQACKDVTPEAELEPIKEEEVYKVLDLAAEQSAPNAKKKQGRPTRRSARARTYEGQSEGKQDETQTKSEATKPDSITNKVRANKVPCTVLDSAGSEIIQETQKVGKRRSTRGNKEEKITSQTASSKEEPKYQVNDSVEEVGTPEEEVIVTRSTRGRRGRPAKRDIPTRAQTARKKCEEIKETFPKVEETAVTVEEVAYKVINSIEDKGAPDAPPVSGQKRKWGRPRNVKAASKPVASKKAKVEIEEEPTRQIMDSVEGEMAAEDQISDDPGTAGKSSIPEDDYEKQKITESVCEEDTEEPKFQIVDSAEDDQGQEETEDDPVPDTKIPVVGKRRKELVGPKAKRSRSVS